MSENEEILEKLKKYQPFFWKNGKKGSALDTLAALELSMQDILDADKRWRRFAPVISRLFPETAEQNGIIESKLANIDKMKAALEKNYGTGYSGRQLLKCDSELPVAGSIKARGGIYEVLKHAETLAIKQGLLSETESYEKLAEPKLYEFFSRYKLAVGSTGNLGLSIGIMGAALGFKVTVHMSADAKEWKKKLLRSKGVEVVEYTSDYSRAVTEGRKQSELDENSYFIDDENSTDLFLGYSVAALRLDEQLKAMGITVEAEHPLFVYLPCGVGGAPGGICFGLKQLYGDNVHCFFVEPTHSPCMLLGLMSGKHEKISVQDIGLDNITEADGLAVGRASGFVGKMVEKLVSGVYTVEDRELFKLLALLWDSEGLKVEPSATPGLLGPHYMAKCSEGQDYIRDNGLKDRMSSATHIAWATGGLFVPEDMIKQFYERGRVLLDPK